MWEHVLCLYESVLDTIFSNKLVQQQNVHWIKENWNWYRRQIQNPALKWSGLLSVPLAKVTYASMRTALTWQRTVIFQSEICCLQDLVFSRYVCVFYPSHITKAWLKKGYGYPAVVSCPCLCLSLIENVSKFVELKDVPRQVCTAVYLKVAVFFFHPC